MLIDIKDIYKIYNEGQESEVRALDGVSLDIDRGEFVAIVGQSGSGKSTLMNVLGCLDIPTYGEYHLNGVDVTSLSDKQLAHIRNKEIGFIFQGFNLIPNLTAVENVELPLIYRGVSRSVRQELSREALKKVGLEHRMDHKPSEMSGGQQQRVAIARAIAQAPPVILADEPTGNLDSNSTKEIMDILEFRVDVEVGGLRKSFPVLTRENINMLRMIAEKHNADEDRIVSNNWQRNYEFHTYLYSLNNNVYGHQALQQMIHQCSRYISQYFLSAWQRKNESNGRYHMAVVDALEKQNIEEACVYLEKDILAVKEEILALHSMYI